MKKLILSLLVTAFLVGCNEAPKEVQAKPVEVKKPTEAKAQSEPREVKPSKYGMRKNVVDPD